MSVLTVGVNQRTAPLEVLERLSVSDTDLTKALACLRSKPNVSEAVVLSTCMRTEVYVLAERFHGAMEDVEEFLGGLASGNGVIEDRLYAYYEDAAATHLFEVAAGIDSAVLGESEILSQVRRAWERAAGEEAAGPVLSGLFRHAVEVGKRARSETAIGRGITSVSQAAVALATERLGPPRHRRSVLVVGAGEVGTAMVSALADLPGDNEILVANRTRSRAEDVARQVGGRPVALSELAGVFETVDVVLTSADTPTVLVEASDLAPAVSKRAGRPLLVVDVAVPRNVDRAVADLDGVTLLDMDDLRAFAESGMEGRRREVEKVRSIVSEEVDRYLAMAAAREAAPLVSALRQRAEEIREGEIERFRTRLEEMTPRQREAVEVLTRGMLAKLMHEPTVRLKEAAGTPRGERLGEALRTLFDL